MSEDLLTAVRALRLTDPELGLKPLLAKLREQQPDLGAGAREVREALMALKAEREATEADATAPPAYRPPPPRRPLPTRCPLPTRVACHRTWRSALLASAAPGCRQRWATTGRSTRSARFASS